MAKKLLTGRGIKQPVGTRFGPSLVLSLQSGGSISVDLTLMNDIRWSAEPVVDCLLVGRATGGGWLAPSEVTTVRLATLDDPELCSIYDYPATAGRATDQREFEEERSVDRSLGENPPKIAEDNLGIGARVLKGFCRAWVAVAKHGQRRFQQIEHGLPFGRGTCCSRPR